MAGKRRKDSTTIVDLPPDMLLLILARLNHNERSGLALVSMSFRSVFSGFVHKLAFRRRLPSDSAFRKLFARFSSVTRISIHSTRIARALTAIANSGLKIECLEIYGKPTFPKMDQIKSLSGNFGTVKALKFEWFSKAEELQVAEFVHLFPSLEDLDLGRCPAWTDTGIVKLASKASNLRKIVLGFNCSLTDRSLDALSTYCVNLDHISFSCCCQMTTQGVCAFVHKMKNLKCLDLPFTVKSTMQNADILTLAETISLCDNLSHLSLNEPLMEDHCMSIIAKSRSPLTSLEFKHYAWFGYSMMGVSAILHAFPTLTKLHVRIPWSILDAHQDTHMSQLVKSLPCLKEFLLFSWHPDYATLFSLIQNCSSLESISICTGGSIHCDVPREIKKNYSIQRINLFPEPISAVKIALKLACPSLKMLTIEDFEFFGNNYCRVARILF